MRCMKSTKLLGMVLFMVSLLAVSVSALPVTFEQVKVDDTVLGGSVTVLAAEKDNELGIRVELMSSEDLKDVQLEAVMRGYDHNDLIQDITSAFDMDAGVTYVKKLNLKLPIRMDKDTYKLRLRVEDKDGETYQENFEIKIESEKHKLWLKDVIFNPEYYVKTGRALLTTVRVENIGETDTEEGIKIKVSVPALGVSASDYIDTLDEGESTTSEELYLRIPACAEAGDYDVNVEVTYDEGDEKITKTETITVVEGDTCPTNIADEEETEAAAPAEKTIISVGATTQDVTVGQGGSIYPITVTNQGASAKTYTVTVDVPGEWATYQVSPSNVAVVKAGETASMFVYVSANENAPVGENMFTVTVAADGEELKQVVLKANVVPGKEAPVADSWAKIKNALEIGLVVLVVLLIILGLIIGFQRLKGDDREDDMGKTYY